MPGESKGTDQHSTAATAVSDLREATDLTCYSADEWNLARQRFDLIRALAAGPDRDGSAAKEVASKLGCSLSLVYRLLARYRADPKLTSCLPARRGRREGTLRLHPSTEAIVQESIEKIYLTRQRVRVSDLMTQILLRCRALGLPLPSRKAIDRRISSRPSAVIAARRHGRKRARDQFALVAGSLEAAWPLSIVQIDHTKVDVIVVDAISRKPIQRPWLTLAIDVCSRCVLGFHLSLDAPSATSVALCLHQAILPKSGWLSSRKLHGEWPAFGIPERLHLDNGKDFHSEALRRGCEQYGIGIDYRPVKTPHYGGHIERLIGTMMGKVHLLPGTTFSSIADKGEINPDKSAAMTLEEVERWFATAIVGVYHQSIHRGIGTTPDAAWKRGIEGDGVHPGRGVPAVVNDPRRLLIDFLPIQRRRVRREGVFLHDISYWSDVLRTWVGAKERMIVRYDPRDLSRIYMLSPDGQYFDLAYRDLRRPAISLWEHRIAVKHLREQAEKAVNEDTIFQAVKQMQQIAQSAVRETRAQRLQREKRKQWKIGKTPAAEAPHTMPPNPRLKPLPRNERLFTDVEEWGS